MNLKTICCVLFVRFVFLIQYANIIQGQCAVDSDIVIGTGPCNYSIDATAYFFTSNTYETILDPPLRVLTGDFIYMGVRLNSTSEPTDHLLLETCWATKRAGSLVHNITDTVVDFPGCPSRNWRNLITLTNNGRSSFVTIRFPNFFLLPDEQEFYLHCSVGACDTCQQSGCDSSVRVPQTFTRTADVISIGPIQRIDFVDNRNTNNEPVQDTSGFLIAAFVLSGFVILMLVLGVAYCLYSRRKKNNLQKQSSQSPNAPVLTNRRPITSFSYSEESSIPSKLSAPPNGTVLENSYATRDMENHYDDAM